MTREERAARIAELRRWVNEQHSEFEDEGFPPDVQEAWDTNNRELREHERVMGELEARDARIRDLATAEENRENGADLGATRGRATPALISRMTEAQVYDLSNIRFNPLNPGQGAHELRDRALRAVEVAHFAHPSADEARCRAHVSGLVRSESDEIELTPLARRILTTGHPDYRRAFGKIMSASLSGMGGFASLSPAEQRAVDAVRANMAVGSGATGGFAVPYVLDPTVIPTSNLSVNPFRAICRTEQITVNEWRGVTSAGVSAAYALEAAEATDNSPTLAQPPIVMNRAQCFIPVSIELTQDWGGLQGELASLIQDAKDDLEATKFTSGSGTNEPQGIITGATTTVTGTGGAASFVIGDLYAMEQALGPRFRPRAQWIANRFVYNKVRQFDTAGGAGLWMYVNQGLNNNVPRGGNTGAELLGYSANEDSAMLAVLTTGSKIAVLGDPRYYVIVDRIGMDIEVIPHLFGATSRYPTGQRGFYAFWRNSAKVMDVNAFRVLITA